MKFLPIFAVLIVFAPVLIRAQESKPPSPKVSTIRDTARTPKSSAAYAEVLLKKAELQSDLESLLVEYTEDYPKVRELRFTLTLLQREIERIAAVPPGEAAKLTVALGKLVVKKVELETDMWGLQRNYKDEHPDVKRAKRKVEIYEAAIKEILG
jgi:hypothetical protein